MPYAREGEAFAQMIPETRYARSGGMHIAYRVHGEGPFDIVVVPPWFWSVDTFGSEPEDVQALTDLSSIGRVIVFDKRGTGSSDQIIGAPTLEERMEDVRAVMDAAGSSCAAVFGIADGGAMSALFAATYPDRVFALALLIAMPRIAWAPEFPWGVRREDYEQITQEMLSRRIQGSMFDQVQERAATADYTIDDDRARRVEPMDAQRACRADRAGLHIPAGRPRRAQETSIDTPALSLCRIDAAARLSDSRLGSLPA
jgi:pimeloyl-ACP methyl ester carboxylesterase